MTRERTWSSTRREVGALVALGLSCVFVACEPAPNEPPNVAIFVIDTLRPDHLGSYGYERKTSPVIDALASEGILFEQVISTAPRTWQSFTSMLTGLYPPRHGVRQIFDRPLRGGVATLPALLAAWGYTTAAFDGENFLRGMTGGRAFQEYLDPVSREGDAFDDDGVVDAFIDWLDGGERRPFFAFVRLGAPHWPYVCPPRLHPGGREKMDAERAKPEIDHSFNLGGYGLRLAKGGGLELKDSEAYRKRTYDYDFTPAMLDHMVLHYDDCVRKSDAAVGRAFEVLRDAGLYDSTLIVVTSDHGESFGEYGYLQHGPQIDDPVMRVPLIVKLPASLAGSRGGVRVEQLARTVDIPPLLLDYLGFPVPPGLDGVSLRPAIDEGRDLGLSAYGESGRGFVGVDPELYLPGVAGKWRMLRTQRWKLVHIPDPDGGLYRLYDVTAPGGEAHDLAAEHPAVVAELRDRLAAIMASESQRAPERSLSEAEKERLRQLGYL